MQIRSLGWEDPRRRAWQPTPIFLPGESCGWKNLVGHGPWSHRELDMMEATEHACTQTLFSDSVTAQEEREGKGE